MTAEPLTLSEVPQRLGVGVLTVRSGVRTEQCPVIRDGRKVRIPTWCVDEMAAKGRRREPFPRCYLLCIRAHPSPAPLTCLLRHRLYLRTVCANPHPPHLARKTNPVWSPRPCRLSRSARFSQSQIRLGPNIRRNLGSVSATSRR